MTDPESVRAAWGARPPLTDDMLSRGVHLPVPAPLFTVMADNSVPVRSIQSHFFRLVDDEVYQPDGPHPYLLHRRTRIIGDGVTVEEQVERSTDALKRARYHAV